MVEPVHSTPRIAKTITPADLAHFVIEAGDGDRFKRLFCEVWNSIPNKHRLAIEFEWPSGFPDVCLSSELVGYFACQNRKRGLAFSARWFYYMPDNVARFAIAHELAHETEYVNDRQNGDGATEWQLEIEECVADNLTRRWGYGTKSLKKWLREMRKRAQGEPEIARLYSEEEAQLQIFKDQRELL